MKRAFFALMSASLFATLVAPAQADDMSQQEVGMDQQDRITAIIEVLESEAPAEKVESLTHLLQRAQLAAEEENNPHFEEKEPVEPLLREVNAVLPFETDRAYFTSLYGWTDVETLAAVWAIDLPSPVGDLSRAEIRQLLEATERNVVSDITLDRFVWFLDKSLGPSFTSDLIFWPYAEWDMDGLTDEVLTRQSLYAEGGEEALKTHEKELARKTLSAGTAPYATLSTAFKKLSPKEQESFRAMLEAMGKIGVHAERLRD